MSEHLISLCTDLIDIAKKAGADQADTALVERAELGVSVRLGKLEDVERSESRDMGLRVMVGQRQAVISSTDLEAKTLADLAERAVAMARAAPEDPYCGLADPARLARQIPDLDLADPAEPTAETLEETARTAEDTGRAVKGITNTEGGGASWSRASITLVTSGGFVGSYGTTGHSLYCALLAGEGTGMEHDYDYSSKRHGGDLDSPEKIGAEAAARALARLGARKADSAQVPIIYDPRVSTTLVGHLAGGVSGSAVARGTSFLKDRMGEAIFPKAVNITDDPLKIRGLGSKPFDGEGVATAALNLIENGVLKSWILDTGTAKQLDLTTTGHASRSTRSPPSPSTTNLTLLPGAMTPEELISDIKSGFYVTELIGMGVNQVTGDYSRGAAGFWIENGEKAYPVSEVTVAGNLKDMFAHLTAANDLEDRGATNAPTVRIDGMTVAGA